MDFVSQKAVFLCYRRFIYYHLISIITTQSLKRTKPHTPQFVLTNGNDRNLRKSVSLTQMLEIDIST